MSVVKQLPTFKNIDYLLSSIRQSHSDLRDYQRRTIVDFVASGKSTLVQIPTGGGKSIVE